MTNPETMDALFRGLEILAHSSPTLLAGAVIGAVGGAGLMYRFRHRFKDAEPATRRKATKPKAGQVTHKSRRKKRRP